jgi:4-hydroxy 2-oxovalerate aldolase
MGISNYSNGEVLGLLELINRYKDQVDYFYVADSFGSLMPKRTREIFTTLRFGTDAALGFHPHNNLQLAFANCLEAMEAGVDIIDGSVFGMGRGAGNLYTDAIIAYYEQKNSERYRLVPILQFADLHMQAQREAYSWGYSLPQLLSGVFHCHPNYPTYLLREKAYTADDIYKMLRRLPEEEKSRYSVEQLNHIKELYLEDLAEGTELRVSDSIAELCNRAGRRALLVCGGSSVVRCRGEIEEFIQQRRLSVYTVNNPQAPVPVDGVFFGNRRRVLQYFEKIDAETEVIFGPEIHEGAEVNFSLNKVSRVNALKLIPNAASPYPMALPSNSAIEAVLGLVQIGYTEIFLCGLDGYEVGVPSHYYNEHDAVDIPEEIEKQNLLIAEELRITQGLSEQLGFSFSIITPTQFTDYTLND